jgi:hypothetical protein
MSDSNREGPGEAIPTQRVPRPDSPADPGWADFAAAHAAWLARLPEAAPIYRLPGPAIRVLSSGSLINPEAADAEHALDRLCGRVRAVGFWDGVPISYPYLGRTPPRGFGSATGMLGPKPTQDRARRLREKKRAEIFRRVKGYAGWLITEGAVAESGRYPAACCQ